MGLPDGRKSFKIGLVVLIQYRLWQTPSQPASHPDRQIDRHVAVASTRYAFLRRAVIRKYGKSWVCLSIRAFTIWQTVMQQNSVKALYQDWASLKQVTGFAAFSRNVNQPPAKVWKELARWSAWYSQVLKGNGNKHVLWLLTYKQNYSQYFVLYETPSKRSHARMPSRWNRANYARIYKYAHNSGMPRIRIRSARIILVQPSPHVNSPTLKQSKAEYGRRHNCSMSILVRRSGSLTITVAFDQLIVWFSWFAWSVRAELLISATLAVRWLLVKARLVFDSHSFLRF